MLLIHATRMMNVRIDFSDIVEITITKLSVHIHVTVKILVAQTDEALSKNIISFAEE